LHRPWPALLILRSDRAQTLIQCLCRLTKQQVSQIRINIAKIGVVHDIESLSAELQPELFADRKLAP
jgi:hypothetical protein